MILAKAFIALLVLTSLWSPASSWAQTKDKEILERSYELSATDQKYPRKQYPTLAGIQTVLDAIADENPKAKTMRPEQFVDARFIKELDDGGYIDALYQGKTR